MKIKEKLKTRMKDSKQKYKFAFKFGEEKGFNLIINRYDKYRKVMYWILFGAFLFMFGSGRWLGLVLQLILSTGIHRS